MAQGRGGAAGALRAAVDPFLGLIVLTLVLAIALPLGPTALSVAGTAADVAIALLFLVYGMRLRTSEVVAGLRNWRLQLAILAATYVLFPLVGSVAAPLSRSLLGDALAAGVLFTALLPSTVQSSVSFTSIARGNIAGALTAATISNLGGILLTPALVLAVMGSDAGAAGGVGTILLQILAPFVVGQILGRWTGDRVRAHRPLTLVIDRGAIVLAVFAAVASATAIGVWRDVTWVQIVGLLAVCAVLLAIMLTATWWGGALLRLPRADRIALLMCGSKKSLATGLPMGLVLFPAATAATMVVPIVVFHQLQLMVCTVLAARLAQDGSDSSVTAGADGESAARS